MDVKNKLALLFVFGAWCSASLATAPGVCVRGNCLIFPQGGIITGPIRPKQQAVIESRSPYMLAPAQTESSPIGKFAIVEQHAVTQAIFVGPSWQGATYEVTGMDRFLSGWDGSSYAKALGEYLPKSEGSIHYAGFSFADLAEKQPGHIVKEIMRGLETGRYQQAPDGQRNYFVIFLDTPATATGGPGADESCAENTFSTQQLNGKPVYFSFIYNLDRAPGCRVSDQVTGNSPELAALASMTARAIVNTVTDPTWSGWQDGNFNEVGDKCAWQYERPFITLTNGSRWKLGELWSDRAYLFGAGYPDANGKRGCIQG